MNNPSSVQEKRKIRALKHIAIVCFSLAFILIVTTFVFSIPRVKISLDRLNNYFVSVELFIARFNKLAAIFVILAFFALKAVLPVIPFSVVFIGTGLVFSVPAAVTLNALGFALTVIIKYHWGKKRGGGNAEKLLSKMSVVSRLVESDHIGNDFLVFALRFIPYVPVGSVSRVYGSKNAPPLKFTVLSVLGFLPRLILWSVVGCNVTEPFSSSFVLPISILLLISGATLLLLYFLLQFTGKEDVE